MMKKNDLTRNLFDFFRKKSVEEIVLESFYFLKVDFGYTLIDIQQLDTNHYFANNFYVYRNEEARKQIEICFSESRFHCIFRRLINGQVLKFSDKENNIDFYDLDILESKNYYSTFDKYSMYHKLNKIIQAIVELFKRHHQFFTTDQWIDTELLKSIKRDDFIKRHGPIDKDWENRPSFFSQTRIAIWQYLKGIGYEIIKDSQENSPFEIDGYIHKMIFSKEGNIVSFNGSDFRDHTLYHLSFNYKSIITIDLSDFPNVQDAVQLIKNSLKNHIEP